ncbi:LINE-1 retrotransposable element ORF2 protein isoform X2 [Diabrotica virgifera virgifera]|uniref:Reverse transcriptase domain-containing protein n=1 Tax=Diabrotica virgifera virgifera TaxID=50390 RepID=A0ABM5JGW2_DIAVI|nr:LINE-1 retrotransposable element ORF2 protein isoform X2 [Diabrotica virgifera virgifera]
MLVKSLVVLFIKPSIFIDFCIVLEISYYHIFSLFDIHFQLPIRKEDGDWAKADDDKAQAFANHLRQVFQPHPRIVPTEEEEFIHKSLEVSYQMSPPIENIKINEIKDLVKNLDIKKAPGYDLISGKICKNLPEEGLRLVVYIFNAIIKLGYFPFQWKMAQIILIPKPNKDPHELPSYRPISLLPVISKIFERLLLQRMNPIIERKKLIPEYQFGFRQQHGTIEQVHRVAKEARDAIEKKEYCTAAFLDVSQAFDKVILFLESTLNRSIFVNQLIKSKTGIKHYANYLIVNHRYDDLTSFYISTGVYSNMKQLYYLMARGTKSKSIILGHLNSLGMDSLQKMYNKDDSAEYNPYIQLLRWQIEKNENCESVIEQLAVLCKKEWDVNKNAVEVIFEFKKRLKIDDFAFEWTVMNVLASKGMWPQLNDFFMKPDKKWKN